MSKRALYLHGGLPKTGTTSLQQWFCKNGQILAQAGLTYPQPSDNYKQGYLVPDLRVNGGTPHIRTVLENHPEGDLLFSNEGLSNHFHDFHPDALAEFRELTAEFHVVLLLLHRDGNRWLRSYYRQAVLNPASNASELWGTTQHMEEIRVHYRIKRLLDRPRLQSDMQAGLGAARVVSLDFDQPDFFECFLVHLGIENTNLFKLGRINESIPVWAISFMRHINSIVPENKTRNAWKAALFKYLDSNHLILRNCYQSFVNSHEQFTDYLQIDLINSAPETCPKKDLKAFLLAVSTEANE